MKTHFTLQELVEQWLAKHPSDANSPTLLIDAAAGYVKTKDGYVWGAEYFGQKKAEAS